jgi:hypothetical protein
MLPSRVGFRKIALVLFSVCGALILGCADGAPITMPSEYFVKHGAQKIVIESTVAEIWLSGTNIRTRDSLTVSFQLVSLKDNPAWREKLNVNIRLRIKESDKTHHDQDFTVVLKRIENCKINGESFPCWQGEINDFFPGKGTKNSPIVLKILLSMPDGTRFEFKDIPITIIRPGSY